MYEGVHAHPDGTATVARQALTAAEYGFEGVIVRNHGGNPASYDPETLETYGIDVVTGVEVRADDPGRASGFVGNHRDRVTVVAVHGGDPAINRFAVGQPAVDVLAHPTRGGNEGVDDVLVRQAADNGVRLELSLRPLLTESGGTRVRAVERLRRLADLVEQYGASHVVSADPTSHLGLRAPRDLVALGEAVGLAPETVREGLAEWSRLAERNRELRECGVERGVRLEES